MQHEIESQWADCDPTSELDRNRYSSNQSACCLWVPSWLGVTFTNFIGTVIKSTLADGTRRHRLHTPGYPSLKAQTKKSNSRDARREATDILEQQIHFQRFVFTPKSSTITTCSPQAGLAAQSARWLARFSGRGTFARRCTRGAHVRHPVWQNRHGPVRHRYCHRCLFSQACVLVNAKHRQSEIRGSQASNADVGNVIGSRDLISAFSDSTRRRLFERRGKGFRCQLDERLHRP